MRRLFSIIFTCVAFAAAARITAPVDTLDLGRMTDTDAPRKGTLVLLNEGADTVSVLKVRTSCGCVDAAVAPTVILPGDSARVDIEYDPRGASGHVSKTVNINTTDGRLVLRVAADVSLSPETVQRRFPVEADSLRLTLPQGGQATSMQFVRVYNGYSHPVRLETAKSPAGMRIKIVKPMLQPGDITVVTFELPESAPPVERSIELRAVAPHSALLLTEFTIPCN